MKRSQHGFGVVEITLVLVIVGIVAGVSWYVLKAKSNINSTYTSATDTSTVTKPQKSTTVQKSPTLDYDSIFNEVASQFGLKKENLRLFWIYSEDKVVYAGKNEGPGVFYVYKPATEWLVASNAINYQPVCSVIDKLPEDYRPPCNATEGLDVAKPGDLTFKYVTDPSVWTSAEQLEKSTNYPAANRYKYIGEEDN